MKAIIFCSGEIRDYEYLKNRDFDNCLIICADGGLRHAEALNIIPDVIIGDGDSYKGDFPQNGNVIRYPSDKDFTDTNLCIDYALEKGYKEIEILGGLGGRRDQEFSHYCLMAYGLSKNIKIKMSDELNEISMENKPFILKKGDKKYVSFFPYGGTVEGFSVKGLKYETENMYLEPHLVQASSNEFSNNDTAEITFKSGTLLVILSRDR